MNWNQWTEIMAWMEATWPHSQKWPAMTVKVTFERLQTADPDDVWTALTDFSDRGNKWAPEPSELIADTRRVKEDRWERPSDAPALVSGPMTTYLDFLARNGFPSVKDAVENWPERDERKKAMWAAGLERVELM